MEQAVFSIEPNLDKTVTLDVPGWVPKLTILYGVTFHAGVSFLCWKIQDTDHVFRIHTSVVYENHGLEYSDHFSLTLKTFREDYKEWENLGFQEDWMKRYYHNYHHLIL